MSVVDAVCLFFCNWGMTLYKLNPCFSNAKHIQDNKLLPNPITGEQMNRHCSVLCWHADITLMICEMNTIVEETPRMYNMHIGGIT